MSHHNTLHAQDKFCEKLEENDECEFVIVFFNFAILIPHQYVAIPKKLKLA
jgi:hypothetical protein